MVRRPLYLNSPPRGRDPEHVAIKIVRNNDTMNGDDCGCHHQRRPAPEQRPDGALWLPKDPCHTHADPTVLSPDTTIETHRAPHLTAPRPGLLAWLTATPTRHHLTGRHHPRTPSATHNPPHHRNQLRRRRRPHQPHRLLNHQNNWIPLCRLILMWARTCATDREDRSGSPDGGLCNELVATVSLPPPAVLPLPPTQPALWQNDMAQAVLLSPSAATSGWPRNQPAAPNPLSAPETASSKGLASSTLSSRTTPPRRSASSCSGLASIIAVLFLSINASFLQ
jgi:hypothetical protein